MICPICELNEAVISVVNLEDYTTQNFCTADFARFGLDIAQATLPPAEILEALGLVSEAPADKAPPEPQAAPGGRKRQKANQEPQAPPEPAPGPPEVAAAPADE